MKKLPHEEGYFRRNSSFPNEVRPSFRHQFDSDKIPTRERICLLNQLRVSALLDKLRFSNRVKNSLRRVA